MTKSNKQYIIDFYTKAIQQRDLEFASRAVTENYIQHNPHLKTGKTGFLEAIEFLKTLPEDKHASPPSRRIISDNDFVIVHSNFAFLGQRKIVLDVFRLENGLIAEHWDAITDEAAPDGTEFGGNMTLCDIELGLTNKAIVQQFCKEILLNRYFHLTEQYIAQDLIQHQASIENGYKAFIESYKNVKVEKVYRNWSEGNFVVTQSLSIFDGREQAVYNIYRLHNKKIVEHWCVSQPIPEQMMHNNGMI